MTALPDSLRDPDAPRPVPPPSPLQAHHVARGVSFEKLEHTLNRRLQRTHKPFDLHGLYLAVTSRGGFLDRPKARKNLSMVEVFRDMENHYDRHTYTDIGTLLLNTYEQTFLEYEREHPQDLNIIACPTCARPPPRRERRAGAPAGGVALARRPAAVRARRRRAGRTAERARMGRVRRVSRVDARRLRTRGRRRSHPRGERRVVRLRRVRRDVERERATNDAVEQAAVERRGDDGRGDAFGGGGSGKEKGALGKDRATTFDRGDPRRDRSATISAPRPPPAADGGGGRTTNLRPETRRGGDAFRRGRCRARERGRRGEDGEDGEDAVMVPAPGWLPWSVADVLHGERDGSPRRAFVPLVRNASLTPRPGGVDVPRSDSQCSLDMFGILLDADASASSPLGPAA